MQIHEITRHAVAEGFVGDLKKIGSALGSKSARANIGKGFVQGVTGADLESNKTSVPQIERVVVSLVQPGNTSPSNYYKLNNVWTNELGQQIQGSKQIAYLNSLIPTHGRKQIINLQEPAKPQARRQRLRRITR